MKVRKLVRQRTCRRLVPLVVLDDPRLAMGRPYLAACIDVLAPQVWREVIWHFHQRRVDEIVDSKIRFRPPKDGQRGVVGRISLSYRLNGEEREYCRRFTVRKMSQQQLAVLIGTV